MYTTQTHKNVLGDVLYGPELGVWLHTIPDFNGLAKIYKSVADLVVYLVVDI
jgi:hypothetical protein